MKLFKKYLIIDKQIIAAIELGTANQAQRIMSASELNHEPKAN